MSLFSCLFSCSVKVRRSCKFSKSFYIYCHNPYNNFPSAVSCLLNSSLFELLILMLVSSSVIGVFFLGILQIYLHAVFWCAYLVCACRQMLKNILCNLSQYWCFRSLLWNYLLDRRINSVGLDFRLLLLCIVNLETVISKPCATNFPISSTWCVLNSFIIMLYFNMLAPWQIYC